MKKIQMGFNYSANPYGPVRTICRAFDIDGSPVIVYANINKDGCVGEPYLMPETEFYNVFVKGYRAVGVC